MRKKYIQKIRGKALGLRVRGKIGHAYNYLFPHVYMKNYIKYLQFLGVNIQGQPSYISSDVYFDGHDYSLITIGSDVTISMGVTLLTHDYSIARGIEAVYGKKVWKSEDTPYFLKPITIGDNCFVGAGSILLPGTTLGENCIVGSHAVVKGDIPDNSVVVGNPAKIVAKTTEWAEKHMRMKDYYPLDNERV